MGALLSRLAPAARGGLAALLGALALATTTLAGVPADQPGPDLGPFTSPLHTGHPLVGTIWSREANGAVGLAALESRLASARFVLLGETHDNADHHRLQGQLVARLAAGRRPPPAVVFEMLDPAHQGELDALRSSGTRDPDVLAGRVAWADSGWPDFALYRPVFAAALDGGLPILAAGLARGRSLAADAPERAQPFGLDEPLPPDEREARLDEMFAGHCELMPREALAPMVTIQRERDARLALRMLQGAGSGGRAILIAGTGHVREGDVPALLLRAGAERRAIVSVGLLEVRPEATQIATTDAEAFDFALFTPAAEREDPCERLRRQIPR